jgi:hypothetical protein
MQVLAVMKVSLHLPTQVVSIDDGLTFSLPTRTLNTLPQWFDLRVEVWFEEEWDADAVVRAMVDNSMVCRLPFTIRPLFDHITDVDDKGPRDRIRVEPRAVFMLDLEGAFSVVCEKKGNASII